MKMRKPAIIAALLLASLTLPAFAENTGLRRLTLRSDTLGWEAVGKVVSATRDIAPAFCCELTLC